MSKNSEEALNGPLLDALKTSEFYEYSNLMTYDEDPRFREDERGPFLFPYDMGLSDRK